MKIRKATIKDFKEIQRLNHALFKSDFKFNKTLNNNWPFSKEGVNYYRKAIINKNYLTLVCEEKNQIIAYLIGKFEGGGTWRKNIVMAEVENTLTEQGKRSKGIGTKLLNEFKKWAKSREVNTLKVAAFVDNRRAIKFYKKKGFKEYELFFEKKI